MAVVDLGALRADNARRWQAAKITRDFSPTAKRLVDPEAKARYRAVEATTGVPWFFIAVVHEREASQSWAASIAQGDRWDRVSIHVPAGRGPFRSWEDAAVDALVNCAPHAAANHDWSVGPLLTKLEEYNGLGYASRGKPSPYIWSGTDQYVSGKYIRDGVYSATTVDSQLGCAGLLLSMAKLDADVANRIAKPVLVSVKPTTAPAPAPQPGTFASLLAKLISIFRRTG